MLGETISHYRIIEPLGEGGMGSVYIAEDITLGRRVAIKFLSSTGAEYRARFLREAQTVSTLIHPNIATVFDYGETAAGNPYIVMELINGQPLSEKLLAGSLPLPEAVRIVSAIAAALGEAHDHGVVHRDVKPSNVVLNERGHVKVVDFGLVKQIGEGTGNVDPDSPTIAGTRTRSDVIVGTPLYLSPEQAMGKPVDGRSDLFALGAVFYECIAGQSAFGGSSVLEIGAQVIHFDPPPPSAVNPDVPRELDRITMKAMQKKIDDRYQTAAELIDDLQTVAPTLSSQASQVGRQTRRYVAPRTHTASALTTLTDTLRRPRLSLGTTLLAVAAVVLLGWLIYQWQKPSAYKPNSQAAEWYAKGTEALRNGAFLQATKAFQQSISSDPNYPLAHARLAEAWFELDYEDQARDEVLKAQRLIDDRSRLARSDTLQVDAIAATVGRDFPAAIAAHSELAKLAPDDPQVHVDLGRAYEKYDDTGKALASYIEATNRSAQYGPAFLRVGMLYGDQADMPSATSSFDKAQALFESTGNFEGQGEVAFQRGNLFDKRDKRAEAKPHLQRALELARTTRSVYLETKTLLKLGNVAAGDGEYESSREFIHQALELARVNNIDNQIKRGLVDLGNSYLKAADSESALKCYRESLETSERQTDTRNAARARLSLGSALLRLNRPDEALAYIDKALPFFQQSNYRKERVLAFTLLARAKEQKGELAEVLKTYGELLMLAEDIGDQSLVLPVRSDLGRTLVILGRFPEAVPHFKQYLAIAKSLQSEKDIALSLIHLANASWQSGHYDEARNYLGEMTYILGKPKLAANILAFHGVVTARMLLSENKLPKVVEYKKQAIELAGTQFKNFAVDASYTVCLAQVFSGDRAGTKMCDESVKLADQTGSPSVRSDALLASAQAQCFLHSYAACLKDATEAKELLLRLGKTHHEWIAWLMIAQASRGTNDESAAQEAVTRASSTLDGLKEKWGSENFDFYDNRPDIRSYHQQLTQLLTHKP